MTTSPVVLRLYFQDGQQLVYIWTVKWMCNFVCIITITEYLLVVYECFFLVLRSVYLSGYFIPEALLYNVLLNLMH